MTAKDIDVREFSWLLRSLPERLPISEDFEKVDPQGSGVWYSSQREHMVGWFAAQATRGAGAYSRKTPNLSARTTWQRLASPGGMIWIAEALGVPADTLAEAVAAVRAEPEKRRRCRNIRRLIPWETIAALVESRRIDTGEQLKELTRKGILSKPEISLRPLADKFRRVIATGPISDLIEQQRR